MQESSWSLLHMLHMICDCKSVVEDFVFELERLLRNKRLTIFDAIDKMVSDFVSRLIAAYF